ncbi:MAG: beta-N-acetylhexosaminidase [Oscillospiraceae bacterium]|nr:beta-N-acetylhexosaminidase [Oscillospiraceae bacterium]
MNTEIAKGWSNLVSTNVVDFDISDNYQAVALDSNEDVSLRVDFENKTVYYKEKSDFFRGFGILASGGEGVVSETARVKKLIAFVDVSRNAVYTIPEMKRFISRLALIGYNACMLHMEDTYEIPEYPYFGYMRGRYSVAELKELDEFADSLGVELMPCIQTLAHLRKTLRWSHSEDMKDTKEVLFVGEDKTYEFIDAMLKSLASAFKTRNIHIGMDEAWTIGRGEYLDKHGFKKPYDIMMEHLPRVLELTKKHGWKPMMWDDMLMAANSGIEITPEQIAALPQDITYVYWDYYNHTQEHYEQQIQRRAGAPLAWAGGTWKWGGFVAANSKSYSTTRCGFEASVSQGINTVINTLWGDDGAEAPLMSVLPGIALYGELRYSSGSDVGIDRLLKLLTGSSLDDFMTIEKLDLLPGLDMPNIKAYNSTKILLYTDIPSMFDLHYDNPDIPEHFTRLADEISVLVNRAKNDEMKDYFNMYKGLADLLAVKSGLSIKLRNAYKTNSFTAVINDLKKCSELAKVFTESFVALWSRTSKPFGLEIVNARLGGVMARCEATLQRIEMYTAGKLDKLEEFEFPLLPYDTVKEGEYPEAILYFKIFSANGYLHDLA